MAVPQTTEELFDLIRKSGVIEEGRLRTYWRQHIQAEGDLSALPQETAARMIDDGILTHLQAGLLLRGKWKNFIVAGKYKLLEHIGTGGMGQVFLCEHLRLCRLVALKTLPTARAGNNINVLRFCREARAAAVLDHPNIIRAHDLDSDGPLHFLVMEYADGRDLQAIIRRIGPLPVSRAVDYAIQAACGLHHAHLSGLIHRDVKPSNLMLERNGQIKLLDLGLARFYADHSDHLTEQIGGRSLIGTADFLSPEQAIDSQSATVRSDIYSLGTTLYFLLAGHAPFRASTVAEKLLQHQHAVAKPIREIRPDVPEALAQVVHRAMMKHPNNRFASCLELIDALMPFTPTSVPLPDAAEMPHLCRAAQAPDVQSNRCAAPPRSSVRMSQPFMFTESPSYEIAQRSTFNTVRPILLATAICFGGLSVGLLMGKLIMPNGENVVAERQAPTASP